MKITLIIFLLFSNVLFAQKFEGVSPTKKVRIVRKGYSEELNEEGKKMKASFPFSDVDKSIPKSRIKIHDGIAVVIGISEYKNKDVPSVDYAVNDALAMREYLLKALGFKEENIIFEINENATQATFKRIFEGQLANFVKPDGSSYVFVYYSGHGAPDPETEKAFLVPYDCDPSYAKQMGYPLNDFYAALNRISAKSVTVVIDACFSGASESGSIIGHISPIFITVDTPEAMLTNGIVFTSSSGKQTSSWYPEKGHGLFTYFFLNGLRGEADEDKNKKITYSEMRNYIEENVSYLARRLNNREQTPQVLGGEFLYTVFVKY